MCDVGGCVCVWVGEVCSVHMGAAVVCLCVNRNVLCGDGESPPGLGSSSLVFLGLPV